MKIKLDTLFYYITFSCNMFCKHCLVNAPYTSLKYPEALSIEDLGRALKDAVDLGLQRLVITGGEPLLYKDKLLSILYLAKNYGIPSVSIETNGFLLNKEYVSKLSEFKDFLLIGLSLDFPDEKRFDEFRGRRGAFRKVIESARLLKESGIKVGIVMSAYKDNLNDIEAVAKLVLEDIGVDAFKINPCLAGGRAKIYIGKEKLLDPHLIIKLIKIVKSLATRYPKKIGVALPPALVGYWVGPIYCPYKRILGILPNGDVSICATFAFHGYIAGNIKESKLKEIFVNSDLFVKIRKLQPKDFSGVCGKCVFAQYCANACPAYALDYYGTYTASFPICQVLYDNGLFPRSFLKTS